MKADRKTYGSPRALRTLLLLLVLAGVVGRSPGARAESLDAKPMVMVLLDTSGSMEYSAESGEWAVPTCTDAFDADTTYEKSRWAAAVEVLTGTFNDYWCSYDWRDDDPTREDYLYPVPHVVMHGTVVDSSAQAPDGLLDIYRDELKFGLMTFDVLSSTAQDQTGGFSYGADITGDGVTSNLGARNEGATWGHLVVPEPEEDLTTVWAANDLVQQEVLLGKPYMGTPIAPMLSDAAYAFAHDDRLKAYDELTREGDPWHDCRKKAVVLITDGLPTLGEGVFGYPTSVAAAAALYAQGISVYVVGFQLPEGSEEILDDIAVAGGTDSAYMAADQGGLTSALGEVLVDIRGSSPSRARGAVTNRTLSFIDKQYQFFASYGRSPISGMDLVGYIDQYVYKCDQSCMTEDWTGGAPLCGIFSIDNALNTRTKPRLIYSQVDGLLQPLTPDNVFVTAELMGVPTTGILPRIEPLTLPTGEKIYSGLSLGDATDVNIRSQYRTQLIQLIRGDENSRRYGAALAAINHSVPVIQPDLFSMNVPIPSFMYYRLQAGIVDRPTVLFVGTNEGMLHAFRVDNRADDEAHDLGEELWGFIPRTLLAEINLMATGATWLFEGSPVVREIRILKESTNTDLDTEIANWRSILISGYRGGGRGFFALDVTIPESFSFLWELSNAETCTSAGSPSCQVSADFNLLGYSYARPAIGAAFFRKDVLVEERGIAILPGGVAVEGESESGKVVYVVDLKTGEKIREFSNASGNVVDTNLSPANSALLDCPMSGDVAAYDDFPGSVITRAYIGDECGQLWLLEMSSSNPEDWTLNWFADAYEGSPLNAAIIAKRRPLRFKSAVAVGPKAGRLVIVGVTGDGETLPENSWEDRVMSISEEWDPDTGGFYPVRNWTKLLDSGEILSAEPLIFDEAVYFTTQLQGSGLCDAGSARLWGIHYTGYGIEGSDNLEPMLDEDGDAATADDLVYYQTFANTVAYGLQLIQRASCLDNAGNYAPWLGNEAYQSVPPTNPASGLGGSGSSATFTGSSGGALELVMQTGNSGTSDTSMQAPSGSGTSNTGNKTTKKLQAPAQSIFTSSWGLLFD